MIENEFPGNSNISKRKPTSPKNQPKKIEKITTGEVIQRKKPLGKRFTETFVGGDARSVGSYILFDVLIPAAKDMVADAMSQGVEKMLFGDIRSTSRRGSRARNNSPFGNVAYHRSNMAPAWERDHRAPTRRARATHDFGEIILETRVEAEEVIERLFDLVDRYEVATVADLYELVGVTGQYTDANWGWADLRGANVARVRNGYLLELPRPEPVD